MSSDKVRQAQTAEVMWQEKKHGNWELHIYQEVKLMSNINFVHTYANVKATFCPYI